MTVLIVGQVFLVFAECSPDQPFWESSLRGNRVMPVVLGAIMISLLAARNVSPLADFLNLAPLAIAGWALASAIALITTLWLEPATADGR